MIVGKPGERSCLNCKYAYCEPDDDVVCALPENGQFGIYVKRKTCGEGLPRFELHVFQPPVFRGLSPRKDPC